METMWLDVFEGVELILNLFTNSMESRAYCPTFNNFRDHGLHSYTYCLCLNLTLNICYFNFFLSLFIFELLDRTCTILYFIRSSDFFEVLLGDYNIWWCVLSDIFDTSYTY